MIKILFDDLFGNKLDGQGIYAVAGIFGSEVLAGKNMTQVTAAGGTEYLGPPSVGIRNSGNSPGNFFIKTRPAAAGVEFAV